MLQIAINSITAGAYPPFKAGRVVGFLWLLVFLAITLYNIWKKQDIYVRPLPAVEAISEAVGRASEMGRPVVCAYGTPKQVDYLTVASLSILKHTAELCARLGVRLIVPLSAAPGSLVTHQIVRGLVKDAYTVGGTPELYDEGNFRNTGNNFYAWAMSYAQILYETQPAANIFAGFITHVAFIAETSASIPGNFSIGSSFYLPGCAMVAVSSQYALISQDVIAASAYLSEEQDQKGFLRSLDLASILFIVVVIGGSLLESIGLHLMSWLVI